MKARIFSISFFISVFCIAIPTYADTLSLTAGSNATTTPNVATAITGFQIVGPSSQTTPVKIRVTNGTLNVSSVSGVTISGNGSGTISLSGTVEKLNQALATLTYTRSSTGTDSLEVSLVEAGEVFFEDNGHLYKFISGSINAINARTSASNQTAYGATGYLATITSQAENDFVAARLQGDGWIGGSDEETEGVWKWVTGPEAGTIFWNGASGGSAPSGQYANWSSGEPNDWLNGNPGEDCIQFYITSTKWNDLNCTGNTLAGYVVEFGADGDMPNVVAQNISIVTADVPAVTSLSPSNGATNVSTTTNLIISFSKNITNHVGNILVKKASDDSLVEAIDVSSGLISGSGTNSITINPSVTLEEGTQYYVIVPNTAFKDGSDNFFDGILENTIWVFTTSDATAPIFSNISASTIATTTSTITWITNENSSTKVIYSTGDDFASTTSETDTSPRVTSHSKSLLDLTACTTYNFKVVSVDGFGNYATSSAHLFTTLGCISNSIPITATTTSIAVNSIGTSILSENGYSMKVETPKDFTSTSSTVVIQIRSMDADAVLATIGTPNNLLKATDIVFDVKALINGSIELDSFDHPVTITYTYTDEDIIGLDESSLWVYHYRDNEWEGLQDCVINIGANTITCNTPNFSIFGIFGNIYSSESGASGSFGGTSIRSRVAHLINLGDIATAEALKKEWAFLFTSPTTTFSQIQVSQSNIPVGDLQYGMFGDDVKLLQQLLNKNGFPVSLSGVGSLGNETNYFGTLTKNALAKFQEANNITPSAGYFGPKTRAVMKNLNLSGVWW